MRFSVFGGLFGDASFTKLVTKLTQNHPPLLPAVTAVVAQISPFIVELFLRKKYTGFTLFVP